MCVENYENGKLDDLEVEDDGDEEGRGADCDLINAGDGAARARIVGESNNFSAVSLIPAIGELAAGVVGKGLTSPSSSSGVPVPVTTEEGLRAVALWVLGGPVIGETGVIGDKCKKALFDNEDDEDEGDPLIEGPGLFRSDDPPEGLLASRTEEDDDGIDESF